jgi:hypothetical protein
MTGSRSPCLREVGRGATVYVSCAQPKNSSARNSGRRTFITAVARKARRTCLLWARSHEYVRRGTVSILAGIDLLSGKVHALVKDRHRSREFIEFLELLDKAYPTDTAIKVILDNHSAHISRKPKRGSRSSPRVASHSPSRQSMVHGSISSRVSSQSSHDQRFVISASRPKRS